MDEYFMEVLRDLAVALQKWIDATKNHHSAAALTTNTHSDQSGLELSP